MVYGEIGVTGIKILKHLIFFKTYLVDGIILCHITALLSCNKKPLCQWLYSFNCAVWENVPAFLLSIPHQSGYATSGVNTKTKPSKGLPLKGNALWNDSLDLTLHYY